MGSSDGRAFKRELQDALKDGLVTTQATREHYRFSVVDRGTEAVFELVLGTFDPDTNVRTPATKLVSLHLLCKGLVSIPML